MICLEVHKLAYSVRCRTDRRGGPSRAGWRTIEACGSRPSIRGHGRLVARPSEDRRAGRRRACSRRDDWRAAPEGLATLGGAPGVPSQATDSLLDLAGSRRVYSRAAARTRDRTCDGELVGLARRSRDPSEVAPFSPAPRIRSATDYTARASALRWGPTDIDAVLRPRLEREIPVLTGFIGRLPDAPRRPSPRWLRSDATLLASALHATRYSGERRGRRVRAPIRASPGSPSSSASTFREAADVVLLPKVSTATMLPVGRAGTPGARTRSTRARRTVV